MEYGVNVNDKFSTSTYRIRTFSSVGSSKELILPLFSDKHFISYNPQILILRISPKKTKESNHAKAQKRKHFAYDHWNYNTKGDNRKAYKLYVYGIHCNNFLPNTTTALISLQSHQDIPAFHG